jgi:hypothetical protein
LHIVDSARAAQDGMIIAFMIL